jgi:periplasmic protein CpxP/Spy
MSRIIRARTTISPIALAAASAALIAAAILATPHFARGDEIGKPVQLVQTTNSQTTSQHASKSQAAKEATNMKGESVEDRIRDLHVRLKITKDEESKWNDVAQAMRDNASRVEKLAADKHATAPQKMTAVEDLKTYQEFAEAHVEGLKNLTSAFETLYDAMPDAQKKNADLVFRNFGRSRGATQRNG